jgi:DNA-binding FrmR family transcriptional regulator
VRIDRHAADRVEHGIRRRGGMTMPAAAAIVMVVSAVRHVAMLSLESDTPWGYIAFMQHEAKATTLKRLGRIEGQVRGLARMVEDDRYCIDIVTQISAVRAALRKVEEEVLRDHVAHCVEGAIASGNKGEQRRKITELMDVLSRTDR